LIKRAKKFRSHQKNLKSLKFKKKAKSNLIKRKEEERE
jgi:hypothetical protein